MAEAKQSDQSNQAKGRKLSPASKSDDPTVQGLLSERSTHQSNNHQQGIDDVDRRLGEMGFSAD